MEKKHGNYNLQEEDWGAPNKHLRRPMTTQVGRPWERNVALRVAGGICRFQTLGSQA